MMLLYNIALKYILCPAELESESLPTEWVCERSSMKPLLLLLWVQKIFTIVNLNPVYKILALDILTCTFN